MTQKWYVIRHGDNDIQMRVELSPWSNFDKIEKSKMAAITICAFIKNDIYLKVIELETSYWCQTICFWYQGIIWNCVYGVTLLRNPIWLPNMWNIYLLFPSAVKCVSKWIIWMINWQKDICIRWIRKKDKYCMTFIYHHENFELYWLYI